MRKFNLTSFRQHSSLIIRFGLALVFLANAYAAWFAPDEFREILEKSFLSGLGDGGIATFIKLIGISDGLVALLLFLGVRTKAVATYASLWILGIILISRPVDISNILEHVGFFSMAVFLWAAG